VETQIVRLAGLGPGDRSVPCPRPGGTGVHRDRSRRDAGADRRRHSDGRTHPGRPRHLPEEAACGAEEPTALLRHPRRAGPDQHASLGGAHPIHAHAKKGLEHSLREAKARHDNYIGVEHLTLALVAINDGTIPPTLSALGAPPATLRGAILDRYRQAS
jgi:hypothetical protein